jgi:glycosyltransferase involved in cell wall biosynthesis
MNGCVDVPEISVVIVAYNERQTIEGCLASLERQQTRRTFEVILIDSSADGTDAVARRFPFVRVQHFATRKYPGDARNAGLSAARGGIIAFLDADCRVESDWIDAVARAHAAPHLAVGSAIVNGSPESLVAWAYYFCEFNLWLPRRNAGEMASMAGCGLSIKRRAFEQYGPFMEDTYCSDTAFHWRLARDGHRTLFDPSIRVAHTVRYRVGGFLSHIAAHRRAFASVVVHERRLSGPKRFAAALATPVLPVVLLPAFAWRVARSERLLRPFLIALPIVVLGVLARTWGELLGFATARGHSTTTTPECGRGT